MGKGWGASCGLADVCLSVCLASGLCATGLVATPLQTLTQAVISGSHWALLVEVDVSAH